MTVNVAEETCRNVPIASSLELRAESGAGSNNLVIVTHWLHRHTQHLIRQRVTTTVHHLLDDVDHEVHLRHALVSQHVGEGGDVVGEVGAVAILDRNTLTIHTNMIGHWVIVSSLCSVSPHLVSVQHLLSVRVLHVLPLSHHQRVEIYVRQQLRGVERVGEQLPHLLSEDPSTGVHCEVEVEVDILQQTFRTTDEIKLLSNII